MRYFNIRVELPNGSFHDRTVNAATNAEAKTKFERVGGYRYFDWRGLVVFVDGAMPCEERRPRQKLTLPDGRVASLRPPVIWARAIEFGAA